ncbi:MAG: hypothetical protein M1296_01500 [Chloroflexi bacterium]|nr:hypothetical protein [Chloroflexota bacterium]
MKDTYPFPYGGLAAVRPQSVMLSPMNTTRCPFVKSNSSLLYPCHLRWVARSPTDNLWHDDP